MRVWTSAYGAGPAGACDAAGEYGGCEVAVPWAGGNEGRLKGEAPFRENGCCGGCLGSIAPSYLESG